LYIYSFVYGRAMHTHHSRYDLLKNLFDVLQRDADPRSSFSVKLALKPQPALVREEPWPDRKNGKQKFFEEDYLSIEGELLDGTVVSENLTELTRKRSFTNPSGKSKTKTRSRYMLALKFRYPNDVYADARPAYQALHEQIRVPPSATVRETRVDEKAITVKSMVQSEKDVVQTTAQHRISVSTRMRPSFTRRMSGLQQWPGDPAVSRSHRSLLVQRLRRLQRRQPGGIGIGKRWGQLHGSRRRNAGPSAQTI
jgi:hypothetical protein